MPRLSTLATTTAPQDATITAFVHLPLRFADGSLGTIQYLANGHKSFPKENLEVFCGGRILQLDNFRSLKGYGWPGFAKLNLWRQDKGQAACAAVADASAASGAAGSGTVGVSYKRLSPRAACSEVPCGGGGASFRRSRALPATFFGSCDAQRRPNVRETAFRAFMSVLDSSVISHKGLILLP